MPDRAAALDDVLAAARNLVAERMRAGTDPDAQRFEISDDAGLTLATVPFPDALEPG